MPFAVSNSVVNLCFCWVFRLLVAKGLFLSKKPLRKNGRSL